jgi:hypothetical protein
VTRHASWVSYGGSAEIVLVAVLAAAAAAVAYAGFRLPLPWRPPRPGRTARIMLLVAWRLAVVALVVSVAVYIDQVYRAGLARTPPGDPATPVTLTGIAIVFAVIALTLRTDGWRTAITSAAIGGVAAPMIFELPFDVIIMPRSHPAINPGLYRPLLFGTLILVDITTLALLPLSPAVRVRRATLWCLAGMLAVFAAWGLLGFSYPSAPGPIALNDVSKVLALVTALTLFLPRRSQPEAPEPAPDAVTAAHPAGKEISDRL